MSNNHFENYRIDTKEFWEKCEETFAHLSIDKWLGDYSKITKYWEEKFINQIDFNSSKVLEYGIGGGYLGKYLFENKNIRSYTGIDISERSLSKTRDTLNGYSNVFLHNTDYDFSKEEGDIFISQACIQHFPSVPYFSNFLQKLNSSKFKIVVLQYRFSNNTFHIEDNPVFSLFTNAVFIKENMTNYRAIHISEIEANGYQYLILSNINFMDKFEEVNVSLNCGFYELNYFRDHYKLRALAVSNSKTTIRHKLKANLKKLINKTKSLFGV